MENKTRTFRFYKEDDGRWFIDLPEWEGEKDALEMVVGADDLLEILSNNGKEVKLEIGTEEFEDYKVRLILLTEDREFSGAWYEAKIPSTPSFECWLCPVVLFIYNEYPKYFYIK